VKALDRGRPVDEALDELYAAPLAEFVRHRNAIATRLRGEGRTREAKAVAAVAKPKATVWACNRVARTEPKLVARVVTAFDRLRAAQLRRPDQMSTATREFREVVEAVAHRAIAVMNDAGLSTSRDTHRRIVNNLRGAAGTARGALVSGSLTDEIVPGGFESFAGTAPAARRARRFRGTTRAAAPAPPAPKRPGPDELAQRRTALLEATATAKASEAQEAAAAAFTARQQLRDLEKAARNAARVAATSRRAAERARRRKSSP
jgi:hypothetical protein